MLKKGQKKAEEKAARAAKKEPAAAVEPPVKAHAEENPKSDSGGWNTTQWLTLGSIAVGLIGIYYKREELKVAFKTVGPKALPPDDGALSPPAAADISPGDCCPVCDGFWAQRLPADGIRVVPFKLFSRP